MLCDSVGTCFNFSRSCRHSQQYGHNYINSFRSADKTRRKLRESYDVIFLLHVLSLFVVNSSESGARHLVLNCDVIPGEAQERQ